jgi:hypothetical protein
MGDALVDLAAQPARDDRPRENEPQVEEIVAAFAPDIENVAHAGRHQHSGPRALALDQRVGDERGAMHQSGYRADSDAARVQQRLHAVQNGRRRILGRGQELVQRDRPRLLVDQHAIGEGAADVYPDPMHCPGAPLASRGQPCRPAGPNVPEIRIPCQRVGVFAFCLETAADFVPICGPGA